MLLVCRAGWILTVKLGSGATHASARPYLWDAGRPGAVIAVPQRRAGTPVLSKPATFPLYLPREACLPFTGLIFLLEPLTIYSLLPPPLPPPGTVLSLISFSICVTFSVWLCISSSFLLFVFLLYIFFSWPSGHGFAYQEVNSLTS